MPAGVCVFVKRPLRVEFKEVLLAGRQDESFDEVARTDFPSRLGLAGCIKLLDYVSGRVAKIPFREPADLANCRPAFLEGPTHIR